MNRAAIVASISVFAACGMLCVYTAVTTTPPPATNTPTPKPQPDVGNSITATQISHKWVKSAMKYPRETAFNRGSTANYKTNNSGTVIWQVAGRMTAGNDFGVDVPHRYECTLQYDGGGVYRYVWMRLDGDVIDVNEDLTDADIEELVDFD